MEKKKSKVKKYIIIGVIIVLIVAFYLYISSNAKRMASTIQNSYIVENTVERGSIEITLTGSGVVEPLSRVEIPKSVTGEVKTDNFEEGDTVKKDSTLYKIGNVTIKSPVKGTLITKNAEKGDYVVGASSSVTSNGAIEPLAVIADISKMKVKIEVDEMEIAKVQLGMKATITADAVEDKVYEGEVVKIASEGKSGNGVTTFDVTIEMEAAEALKIGMNVDVELKVESKENVLKIPMEAINKNKKETYVYVKDETYVADEKNQNISLTAPSSMAEVKGYKKVNVEVGTNNQDEIEIISGIEEGEKVYSINTSKTLMEYMMQENGGMSIEN